MRYNLSSFGDFKCAHCHVLVSSAHALSGVNNRNHCPYCLWSCHLDLYAAGDRLCACKGQMKPIGLTLKKSRNKYQRESGGELMLIHECIECGSLSINRIAADDDPSRIVAIFQASIENDVHKQCETHGILVLQREHAPTLYRQLYASEVPVAV